MFCFYKEAQKCERERQFEDKFRQTNFAGQEGCKICNKQL